MFDSENAKEGSHHSVQTVTGQDGIPSQSPCCLSMLHSTLPTGNYPFPPTLPASEAWPYLRFLSYSA